jgi:VanZ family protein
VEDFHQTIARVGLALIIAYIVYTGVVPCTFGEQTGGLTASVNNESFLPFFAYFMSRFDLMMADAMQKFASYMLFAMLLAMWWSQVARSEMRSPVLAITAVGVSLSLLIELVQLFIPVRVTSLTDPILAGAGCVTGVLAQRHIADFYHFARTRPPAYQVDRARRQRSPFAELPLDDALIATLYDPRPDAPVEPSPKRVRPWSQPRPKES